MVLCDPWLSADPATEKVCHAYGVSINEYLVATFIWAAYQENYRHITEDRPLRVAVPVNLRPYFDSITTKNFFVMVSTEFAPQKTNIPLRRYLPLQKTVCVHRSTRNIWKRSFPTMYPMS